MPKKYEVLHAIDKHNKEKVGTQFAKTIKIRESTYDMLVDLKKNDKKLKSLDDVIINLITLVAILHGDGQYE